MSSLHLTHATVLSPLEATQPISRVVPQSSRPESSDLPSQLLPPDQANDQAATQAKA